MQCVNIPQRVDEPPHILLWSADELLPVILSLIIGVVICRALMCTLIGLLAAKAYRKFRDRHLDGFLLHLLWYHGFWFCRSRYMQHPYVRFFISR